MTIIAFIGLVKPRIWLEILTSSHTSTYTDHLFSLGFGDTVSPMPTLMDPFPSKVIVSSVGPANASSSAGFPADVQFLSDVFGRPEKIF